MKSIYSYIKKNGVDNWMPEFDSHTHLWGISDEVKKAERSVRFIFNPMKTSIDAAVLSLRRADKKTGNDLLAGTGNTTGQLLRVMKDDRFDAIGEVIINKHYTEYSGKVTAEHLVWKPELFEALLDEKRPIYIHFDLVREEAVNENLERFLQLHDGPVVLCHCGLNRESGLPYKEAFDKFMNMQADYSNLWGEISWDCMDWIMSAEENGRRGPVIAERMIAGTDLTPYDSLLQEKKRAWQLAYLDKLSEGKLSRNTAELFGI